MGVANFLSVTYKYAYISVSALAAKLSTIYA